MSCTFPSLDWNIVAFFWNFVGWLQCEFGWFFGYLQALINIDLRILDFIFHPLNTVFYILNEILSFTWSLTELVLAFMGATWNMFWAVYNMMMSVIYPLFSANPYAFTVFLLILTAVSSVFFARIWNIIADLQLFGIKLPKIPM